MRQLGISGTKIHWREDGDPSGPAVIFANSLGTDLRLWDPIIPLLPAGFRYIRFDKRGHGLSDVGDQAISIDLLASDAETLLNFLEVDQVIFVGLSIGGMIGQCLATRRPDLVKAFVLSNSAARLGSQELWDDRIRAVEDHGIEAIADQIMERWFARTFLDNGPVSLWRNMLVRTSQEGYVGCSRAISVTDLTDRTKTLDLPFIAIGGDEDGASPAEVVRATCDLVSGSSFHLIKDAGHLPCVEKHEEYAEIISAFLKKVAN